MSKDTLNKGGRIARASVIAKMRRMKKRPIHPAASAIKVQCQLLDDLIEWVNFSASRYGKRPGGLGGRSR